MNFEFLHFLRNELNIFSPPNLSYFAIMYTILQLCKLFLLLKSRFTDHSHFWQFVYIVLFPAIEVMKYVDANSLEIIQK